MEIHFHAHHAEVSDAMRLRTERLVRRAAARLPRAVDAVIHFEQDGILRRVSVTVRAPENHELVGCGEGRYFGPTLALAVSRLLAQASKEKKSHPKGRAHRQARVRV